MAISKPTLPPKRGYIEVEIDGRRTYRNVETGILIEKEATTRQTEPTTEDLINILLGIEVENE